MSVTEVTRRQPSNRFLGVPAVVFKREVISSASLAVYSGTAKGTKDGDIGTGQQKHDLGISPSSYTFASM